MLLIPPTTTTTPPSIGFAHSASFLSPVIPLCLKAQERPLDQMGFQVRLTTLTTTTPTTTMFLIHLRCLLTSYFPQAKSSHATYARSQTRASAKHARHSHAQRSRDLFASSHLPSPARPGTTTPASGAAHSSTPRLAAAGEVHRSRRKSAIAHARFRSTSSSHA